MSYSTLILSLAWLSGLFAAGWRNVREAGPQRSV